MRIEQFIGAGIVAWTALLVVILPAGRVDALVTLLLIGLLAARAVAGAYAPKDTNVRVDLFVLWGVVAFSVFVAHRVWTIVAG